MTLVEIWLYSLAAKQTEISSLAKVLSEDERARAKKFAHADHGKRFIVGRARMRQILSGAIDLPPEHLQFSVTSTGKPFLSNETPQHPHFNLSHTADTAALAICNTAEVGVDIEAIRPLRDGFARRFFTKQEADEIDSLPEEQRLDALVRCWTRKEAYLKATGAGIAHGLASFQVSVKPDEPAKVLAIDGGRHTADAWDLHDFSPAPEIAGAAAVRAPDGAEFRVIEFSPDGSISNGNR
ncbi:MAG: 4'-phosphopantetheinyl transferase superfamily protein [Filomicrobium sp.]